MITDHGKEAKFNKYGKAYCPTPIEKSPDGKTVLKWCTWSPTDLAQIPTSLPEAPKQELESKPNWDAIAEGKVRNSVAVATIQTTGTLVPLTEEMKELMNQWVNWIMEGV